MTFQQGITNFKIDFIGDWTRLVHEKLRNPLAQLTFKACRQPKRRI